MPDLHHNVFGYYRGPSRSPDERAIHKQVEDNTTKALINVLEHSEPSLLPSFLGRFVPELAPLASSGGANYFLQGGPASIPSGPRCLLGISVLGEVDPTSSVVTGGSRVDAAIAFDVGGMLAIEVKTVDRLDAAQLRRHSVAWEISGADATVGDVPNTWKLARWADVWRWARDPRDSEPVTRFLLAQLATYLERIGLAPWAGFLEEDFRFFDTRDDEQRAALKNRMAGLWPRVLERLPATDARRLGTVKVGRVGAHEDIVWAQTNRDEDVVNLTAELSSQELQLNAVGWKKASAAKVERALLDQMLPALPTELVVYERTAPTGNWRAAVSSEVARFTDDEVRSGAFAIWRERWPTKDSSLLAFHLRRAWSRAEILGRGDAIVGDVVSDIVRLIPWLAAINGWGR